MSYIIIRNYSRFHDHDTNTEFSPVLDVKTQQWVGAANVSTDFSKKFEGRGAFEVLSDPDYLALITPADKEIVDPFVLLKEDAKEDENHMEDLDARTDDEVAKAQDEAFEKTKKASKRPAPPEPAA